MMPIDGRRNWYVYTLPGIDREKQRRQHNGALQPLALTPLQWKKTEDANVIGFEGLGDPLDPQNKSMAEMGICCTTGGDDACCHFCE